VYKEKPTRKECGCTESSDIGTYGTCPHGCIYCYANVNKQRAVKLYSNHDKNSAFLGFNKSQSDKWLAEIKTQTLQDGGKPLDTVGPKKCGQNSNH